MGEGGLTSSTDLGQSAYDKKVRDALKNPQKAAKAQLGADTLALQTNPLSLGMSDAERQKLIGEASQQATEQQQAGISQLNRGALGGQGFQAGEFNQAAKDTAAQVADTTAKATVGINQLNDQMVNQEKERILAEMDAASARKRETANFWRGLGIDAVAGLIGFATANPALGAAIASGANAGTAGTAYQAGQQAGAPAPTAPVMP